MSDHRIGLTAIIRLARVDEASLLGELALRSKAHWGYDAAFLDACREDLAVSADDIAAGFVSVLEVDGRPVGFYQLRPHAVDEVELVALFVEPRSLGQGCGKRLWRHAVATAKQMKFRQLILQSEPHAEGFYRAMGAEWVGESESTVFPGRKLPLMRIGLT